MSKPWQSRYTSLSNYMGQSGAWKPAEKSENCWTCECHFTCSLLQKVHVTYPLSPFEICPFERNETPLFGPWKTINPIIFPSNPDALLWITNKNHHQILQVTPPTLPTLGSLSSICGLGTHRQRQGVSLAEGFFQGKQATEPRTKTRAILSIILSCLIGILDPYSLIQLLASMCVHRG